MSNQPTIETALIAEHDAAFEVLAVALREMHAARKVFMQKEFAYNSAVKLVVEIEARLTALMNEAASLVPAESLTQTPEQR